MEYTVITVGDKSILLDCDDFKSLPHEHSFKFDKDGYALIYFYCKETRREENVRLSRWVLFNPKGLLVDHINHNILDNRKCNLRVVTKAQNAQNSRPKKNTYSKYKGVSWYKKYNKWTASIKVNGRTKYLGSFSSEEIAARAYDKAAKESFGEYAYLNFKQ